MFIIQTWIIYPSDIMNANTTKMIAIAIVAILVIAGVAIYLNSSEEVKSDITGKLEVYGNADEDYTIDSEDLDIINNIIDGKDGYTLEKYPRADSNNDGKITSEDADIVKNIIDKKPTTIVIQNYHFDGRTYTDTVKWPVKAVASTAISTILSLHLVAGTLDVIKGITYETKPNAALYPELQDFKNIGPDQRQFDIEEVSKLKTEKNITAIFCQAPLNNEEQMKEMGLDIIRPDVNATTYEEYASALLLAGFICGKQNKAVEASEWYADIMEDINSKVGKITENDKVKAMVTMGYNSVWKSETDYAKVASMGGATFAPELIGPGTLKAGDWMYTTESNMIVCVGGGSNETSWYGGDVDIKDFYKNMDPFTKTKIYEEGNIAVVSGHMPVPLKVMYTSAVMYPDLYDDQWLEDKHQDFVDKFYGDKNFDISKLNFTFVGDELKP